MTKNFFWTGINNKGQTCKGVLRISSEHHLQKALLNKGIILLKTRKIATPSFLIKPNYTTELIYFFSGLSVFLNSGINLVDSLTLLSTKKSLKRIKVPIENIIEDLKRGLSFNESLTKYADTFSTIIVHMINVGEMSGELALICSHISDYLSRKESFSKKIKKALLGPILTFTISIIITLLIFVFIIPRFEFLLTSLGKPLPSITKFMFLISSYINSIFLFYFLTSVVAITLFSGMFLRDKKYKKLRDQILLHIPFIGPLRHLLDLIRFTRSFAVLHSCGVPIIEALNLSGLVVKNLFFRDKILALAELIKNGSSVEMSMKSLGTAYFPSELVAIVSVGENSDNLSSMLERAGLLLEKDLDYILNTFVTILNPLVMIFLGVLITALMLAVYLPIFNLATSI